MCLKIVTPHRLLRLTLNIYHCFAIYMYYDYNQASTNTNSNLNATQKLQYFTKLL